MSPTLAQKYLSTRGAEYGKSFEDVVMKGLASDGGLFIPEEIPSLPENWESWADASFEDLAFNIMSLFVSPDEVPSDDLKDIIKRSYSTFDHAERTPLVELDPEQNLFLLELWHGPTRAFKDVALQFLGNLFEYFLKRENEGKVGKDRHHLTVVGATSGDTGSAAIYGLRNKKDTSVFILFPDGKVSPIQEKQMTTVLDPNVHNLTVQGSFDDCQDIVKALFADPDINSTHSLGAVNSINWARILAQITYYFYSFFSLKKKASNFNKDKKVHVVVPSGNFGDILAGYFAKRLGLPIEKLTIATNENDILDRFFRSGGHYTKKALNTTDEGVKETHSPAMDILVSSNFERLLWFLAFQTDSASTAEERRQHACESVTSWLNQLKSQGGFQVPAAVLEAAKVDFDSHRVSNDDTISTIRSVYKTCFPKNGPSSAKSSKTGGYILDPHSAVGIAASQRSIQQYPGAYHISLSTAHPAKFAGSVDLALRSEDGYVFNEILPKEFIGLEQRESRVTPVPAGAGWEGVREIVKAEVEQELQGQR